MRGGRVVIAILLMSLIGAAMLPSVAAAESAATQAGVAATQAWLKLVDSANYGKSYTQSSSLFRSAISEDNWVSQISAVRRPLGTLISRKPLHAKFHASLPGASDGQYVVVTYKTSFDRKHAAVETVTAMLDQDRQWHVAGYYIK